MKKCLFSSISVAILIFLVTQTYSQTNQYTLKNTFHIASAGGWDYIAINTINNSFTQASA